MFKFIVSMFCIVFFGLSALTSYAAIKDRPEEEKIEDIRG
jgi:hypothetical protein